MSHCFHWRLALVVLASAGGLMAPLAAASGQAAELRPFTARDMLDIVRFGRGSITASPDGSRVAWMLPDMADEHNVLERRPSGYVYVRPLSPDAGDATSEKLTDGAVHSSFPAWSPDGSRLAFFSTAGDGSRLAVWNATSGETRTYGVPFRGQAYLTPQWDAGGTRIVYARAAAEPGPGPAPRVVAIESSDARIPGDAVFVDRRQAGLAVVDLADGGERALLAKPLYLRGFAVSPAGGALIYRVPTEASFGLVGQEVGATYLLGLGQGASARLLADDGKRLGWRPDGKRLIYRQAGKLHEMTLKGRTRPLPDPDGLSITGFAWSPNGKRIAALVADRTLSDPEIEPPQPAMFTIARPFTDLYLIAAGGGAARNLTADISDRISDPVWAPDGRALFFRAVNNRTYDETLYRYDLKTGKWSRLTGGTESFANLTAAGSRLLFTAQSATRPPDLFAVDPATGARRQISALNPQLAGFRFSTPRLFYFYNGDGERLGALLYRPVNVDAAQKIPVITYVYEKLTPGIHRFSPRHQIFLNHGYAVLMPNVKVKVGETGESFVKSVVPATAAVRAMGFTNGKFAMWGGSFGAYATSYVITRTALFAAAVSRATPPELFRNWASGRDRDSDNIERGQARMGGSPFDYMERYLSQSAFFHLDKVTTPVLLMHGMEDKTILYGEGEMMFYALRRLGKTATFVGYTHGDHSLYRHSRADAIDVHRRMLAWFDRYLKDKAPAP